MKKIFFLVFLVLCVSSYGETIEVWHYYLKNLEKQLNAAARDYEVKSGNKIILKKVPMDVMNTRYRVFAEKGGGPDIIIGPADWIGQFNNQKGLNLLVSLDNYVTEKKKNTFLPQAFEFCSYEKLIFGLPFGINNLALVYNKDLIKSAPKTTKEMIKKGKELMTQKKGVYGLVYNNRNYYYHWVWVTGFDGNPFKNKKTTYNSVEQIKAMEFAKSLEIGENSIMPADLNEEMAVSMFGNGKAGMIITGPWEINEFLKKGINVGVAILPVVNETAERAKSIIGGDVLMISSNAKQIKLCYEFIDYLTSPAVQEIMFASRQFIPSVKSVYGYTSVKQSEIYPIVEGFMEQAKYSYVMPREPELMVGVWAYGNSFLGESFEGKRSIKNIADEIQHKAINALNEYAR